jgi:hypothetical protein
MGCPVGGVDVDRQDRVAELLMPIAAYAAELTEGNRLAKLSVSGDREATVKAAHGPALRTSRSARAGPVLPAATDGAGGSDRSTANRVPRG